MNRYLLFALLHGCTTGCGAGSQDAREPETAASVSQHGNNFCFSRSDTTAVTCTTAEEIILRDPYAAQRHARAIQAGIEAARTRKPPAKPSFWDRIEMQMQEEGR